MSVLISIMRIYIFITFLMKFYLCFAIPKRITIWKNICSLSQPKFWGKLGAMTVILKCNKWTQRKLHIFKHRARPNIKPLALIRKSKNWPRMKRNSRKVARRKCKKLPPLKSKQGHITCCSVDRLVADPPLWDIIPYQTI